MEKVQNKVVKALGHEHKGTIWFFEFCEENPNADIEKLDKLAEALIDLVQYVNSRDWAN